MRIKTGVFFGVLAAIASSCGCGKRDCTVTGCGADEVCDLASGACTVFDAGAALCDCPATRPVCEDGICKRCTAREGCSGRTPVCDLAFPGGRCVQCLDSSQCDADGGRPRCDLATQVCVQCVADTQCPQNAPRCDRTLGLCSPAGTVVPPSDGGEDGGADGGSTDAGSPDAGPTGETCRAPLLLAFSDAGVATATADTSRATDDHSGSCNGLTGGPELVYRVHLAATGDLQAVAAPRPASAADPVLWIRSAPCGAGTELGCADATRAMGTEQVTLRRAPPGDYDVYLETYGTTVGLVDLTITVSAATALPANDTCAGPLQVMPFNNGTLDAGILAVTFTADTRFASDDHAGSCNATPGSSELVYQVPLMARQDLHVTATPMGLGADTVIYLRQGACDAGVERACSDRPNAAVEAIDLLDLPAGTYFLFVERYGAQGGGLTDVSITLTPPSSPPANDTCAAPQTIAAQGAVLTGRTTNAGSDRAGTCGGPAGDAVYVLTLTTPQDVSLTVTPEPGSPRFWPAVTLEGPATSCASATELGCAAAVGPATPATLTTTRLAPGTYYIWVDGADLSEGSFQLRAAVTAPTPAPANDVCTGAVPLVFDAGVAQAQGTLFAAGDDHAGPCEERRGGDVVYAFTTSGAGSLTVDVTQAAFAPVLYTLTASACLADGGLDLDAGFTGCASTAQNGERGRLVVSNLPAGAHLLVVDSHGAQGAATFQLAARLLPAATAAANDGCAGALTLALATEVEGDTTGAAHDALACVPGSAPDLVYAVQTPAAPAGDAGYDLRLMVLSRNALALSPLAQVQSGCAGGAPLACESGANPLSEAVLLARGLAPSTRYYAWVGSAVAQTPAGAFTIRADLAGPPANDGCAAALSLPANTSVAGTTLGAADDLKKGMAIDWYGGSPACSAQFPGGDVVYRYVAGRDGPVRVTVQPQRGFDPGLAVISACAPSSCVATTDRAGPSDAETLVFDAVTGQAYFVVVDSFTAFGGAGRGGFLLSVQE